MENNIVSLPEYRIIETSMIQQTERNVFISIYFISCCKTEKESWGMKITMQITM